MDFFSIDYLKKGTAKQQEVYDLLTTHQILAHLHEFTPVVVGTFPLDIAIDTSDIDIACSFVDLAHFQQVVQDHFQAYTGFNEVILNQRNPLTYVANFEIANFPVEIFAQTIPVTAQYGYRHLCIEYEILQKKGNAFKEKVKACKQAGWKTEPAFATLLNLKGDPYESLLQYVP